MPKGGLFQISRVLNISNGGCPELVYSYEKNKLWQQVCRTVVRAARIHGQDTVAITKRQEADLDVSELKMLRF